MQTLNVGAGLSDQEYRDVEASRRAEQLSDAKFSAQILFWAAGAAALSSGLLPVRFGLGTAIGFWELLALYGRTLTSHLAIALVAFGGTWAGLMAVLGYFAHRGARWAFLIAIALYAADTLALIATFSLVSCGVHGFFLWKWWEGQQKLKELSEPAAAAQSAS